MKRIDVFEAIEDFIKKKIFSEWKHEGYTDEPQEENDYFHFCIDGKDYTIKNDR